MTMYVQPGRATDQDDQAAADLRAAWKDGRAAGAREVANITRIAVAFLRTRVTPDGLSILDQLDRMVTDAANDAEARTR